MLFFYWCLYLLLAIILIGSLYLALIAAPGLWVMVIATIIYAILTGGITVGLKTVFTIIIIAGVAELLEFIVMGRGAKKAGASRRGLWGALIGSVIGALFFTIPLPIIGTIIGVCLGAFVGAIVGELWGGTEVGTSLRVGYGAAKGRLFGIFTKVLFGCVIIAIVLIGGIPPIHLKASTPTPGTSSPAQTSPLAPPTQPALPQTQPSSSGQ
jgi:uncharacterized protein YqgC (DUF456 family)